MFFYSMRAATLIPKREFNSSTRTSPPGSISSSFVVSEYSNFAIIIYKQMNKMKR